MIQTTPRKAITRFCKECNGNYSGLCSSPKCKLYPYQKHKTTGKPPYSPLKTIQAHCLGCSANNLSMVGECSDRSCFLYSFRLGKNPFIKKDKKFMAGLGKNTQFQRRKTANWEAGINDLPSSVQR